METRYNYDEAVWVSEHMAASFIELVNPQEAFAVEHINDQWVFSFSNDEDLKRAEIVNGALLLGIVQ